MVGNGGLRLAGVAGVNGLVFPLAQGEGDHVANGGFVVDDEDAFLHGGAVPMGCVAVNDSLVTVS